MIRRGFFALALLGIVGPLDAEATPIADISVPDVATARAHFLTSPYGPWLRLPLLDVVRHALYDYLEQQGAHLGCDLHALGRDIGSVRAQVLGESTDPEVTYRVALACPHLAASTWAQMIAHAAGPAPIGWGPWLLNRDAWWLCAGRGVQPVLPAITATPLGTADLVFHADLLQLCRSLDWQQCSLLLTQLGVSSITGSCSFGPGGSDDSAEAVVGHLPLLALDPQALHLVPRSACLVWAMGVSGPEWAAIFHEWHNTQLIPAVMGTICSALQIPFQSFQGLDLEKVVHSLSGTIAIAISPGMPYPGITVIIPRSEVFDDMLKSLHGDDLSLTHGDKTDVQIVNQMLLLEARCTASHWIFSTDSTAFDPGMAGPAFNDSAGAHPLFAADEHPVAMAWQDNRRLLTYLSALLPVWRMSMLENGNPPANWMPSERGLDFLEQAVVAAGALTPESQTVVLADHGGVHARSRNGIAQGGLLGLVVLCGAPAILECQETVRESVMGSWETTMASACTNFANAHSGVFPLTLRQAGNGSKAMDDYLHARLLPANGGGYVYVRPSAGCNEAKQPMIIQDPALTHGRGSEVVYVDGHIEFQAGTKTWTTALRLSRLAASTGEGIPPALWGIATTKPEADAAPPSNVEH